jgi:hypothetical protein
MDFFKVIRYILRHLESYSCIIRWIKRIRQCGKSSTVTEDESRVELGLPSLDAPCKNYTRPNRFPRDSSLEEESKYR